MMGLGALGVATAFLAAPAAFADPADPADPAVPIPVATDTNTQVAAAGRRPPRTRSSTCPARTICRRAPRRTPSRRRAASAIGATCCTPCAPRKCRAATRCCCSRSVRSTPMPPRRPGCRQARPDRSVRPRSRPQPMRVRLRRVRPDRPLRRQHSGRAGSGRPPRTPATIRRYRRKCPRSACERGHPCVG